MTLTTTTTSPESNADEDKSSAIAQIISGRLYFTSYGLNFNVPDDDEKTIYLDIEEHLHYGENLYKYINFKLKFRCLL